MFKYLGASTSSHQIEGNVNNDWIRWELKTANNLAKNFDKNFSWLPNDIFDRVKVFGRNPKNYISDKVVDHYHRYKEDLQILKTLKLNSYRFSIEWARVEPERGKYSRDGIEFYKNIIKELKKLNITPFITLWHFTNPTWVVDSGWLFNKKNRKAFVNYAEKIVTELKAVNQDIKFIMTVNEPYVYIGQNFGTGSWVQRKNIFKLIRSPFIFRKIHIETYKRLKQKFPDLQISFAKNMSLTEASKNTVFNNLWVKLQMFVVAYSFLDFTKKYVDWIGINYYFFNTVDFYLKYIFNGFKHTNNKNDKVSDLGWWLRPDKIGDLLIKVWNRYHIPIIITENGLADAEDQYRSWFIEETMKSLKRAENKGVDIQGYLHWALLDNFEWDKGYWPRFGLVEVNFNTGKRTIRKSAYDLYNFANKFLNF